MSRQRSLIHITAILIRPVVRRVHFNKVMEVSVNGPAVPFSWLWIRFGAAADLYMQRLCS